MRSAVRVALGLLAPFALLLAACGDDESEAPRYAPPTRPHAALLLEPPVVAIGEVAEVVLAVVTPPDHAVRAYAPPEAIEGLWVLDARVEEIEREGARWVHRTRVRVRAREVGRFEYPGAEIEIELPDGSMVPFVLEPLAVEVVSVLAEHADQGAPFGIRRLVADPAGGGVPARVAFAAGVILALATVGLVALARRRLTEEDSAPSGPTESPEPPWLAARSELSMAAEEAESDPVAALDRTARALRRYAALRFRGETLAPTLEELTASTPPFLMTTRWTPFLDLIRRIDAARFPPARPAPADTRALVEQALRFVEDSVPRDVAT